MENKTCSKPPISLYNADFTKSPLLQLAMENQLRNGGKEGRSTMRNNNDSKIGGGAPCSFQTADFRFVVRFQRF